VGVVHQSSFFFFLLGKRKWIPHSPEKGPEDRSAFFLGDWENENGSQTHPKMQFRKRHKRSSSLETEVCLAVLGKVLFLSQIYVFSSKISHHALHSCLRHRFLVWLSQATVVSLFPDRRMARTRRGTCFPDRRVRVVPRFSDLVCGFWLCFCGGSMLLVSWEMVCALYAPTQAMVSSFSGDGSGCFLFGLCIFLLFTVYFLQ